MSLTVESLFYDWDTWLLTVWLVWYQEYWVKEDLGNWDLEMTQVKNSEEHSGV
jgi:hypothetical protein